MAYFISIAFNFGLNILYLQKVHPIKGRYQHFFCSFQIFFRSFLKFLNFVFLCLFNMHSHRMTICNLYTMPRMPEPVWLTMMSGALEKNQLCGHFMRELSLLMEHASKNQLSTFLKNILPKQYPHCCNKNLNSCIKHMQ